MKHLLLILALSATVMLTGLGSSRLWDDDEPRNAGCAREMLARWDWIVPWFNNELRAHKPVLTYWCIMASYLVLGESEFSARLPSALAAIGTTLLTYSIGRRLFSLQAALWAALILPTTMLFAMAGRIATPDSLLIFCVTLTMAVYLWTAWPVAGATSSYFPTSSWPAAAIYAAMGLAALAKGPVGVVLPTAILGMFLLLTRSVIEGESRSSTRLRFGFVSVSRLIRYFLRTAWSMRPLTALAIKQGGYDWGFLAFAVGFGGSMIWFGSSAGVALSNMYPQAKSVGAWLRHGWHVALAYVAGFVVMLALIGFHPGSTPRGSAAAPSAPAASR